MKHLNVVNYIGESEMETKAQKHGSYREVVVRPSFSIFQNMGQYFYAQPQNLNFNFHIEYIGGVVC